MKKRYKKGEGYVRHSDYMRLTPGKWTLALLDRYDRVLESLAFEVDKSDVITLADGKLTVVEALKSMQVQGSEKQAS